VSLGLGVLSFVAWC